MATEPSASPSAPSRSASPIENELPAYRAISTWAIAGMVLGLVSVATYASLLFLVASAGAILAGAVALRQIRRYPDLLTGAGLANFGIALGLITGLSAPTIAITQRSIIGRQANAYGAELAEALQGKPLADAFWLANPPTVRANATPQKLMSDIESAPQQEEMMGDPRLAAFRAIARRVGSSDAHHVHVDGIESRGFRGITPFANVRLVLDGPETDEFPAEEFALLALEAMKFQGSRQWYVSDVTYPYEAGSRSGVVESAHGHDH